MSADINDQALWPVSYLILISQHGGHCGIRRTLADTRHVGHHLCLHFCFEQSLSENARNALFLATKHEGRADHKIQNNYSEQIKFAKHKSFVGGGLWSLGPRRVWWVWVGPRYTLKAVELELANLKKKSQCDVLPTSVQSIMIIKASHKNKIAAFTNNQPRKKRWKSMAAGLCMCVRGEMRFSCFSRTPVCACANCEDDFSSFPVPQQKKITIQI